MTLARTAKLLLLTLLTSLVLLGAEHAAEGGHEGGGHEDTLSSVLMHHITNQQYPGTALEEWHISKAVVMMMDRARMG